MLDKVRRYEFKFFPLLLVLWFHISAHATQLDVVMDETLTQEISNVAEAVYSGCAPPDCIIIALGRSPTPVFDYLQFRYPGSVVGLPLSGFRYSQSNPDEQLTKLEENKLFAHFDSVFEEKLTSAKRVVIMDYSISGQSALSSTEYIEKYLRAAGKEIQVETLFLVEKGKAEQFIRRISMQTQVPGLKISHITLPQNLGQLMYAEAFDDLAPYGQYDLKHDKKPWPAKERERTPYLRNLCNMIGQMKR